MSKLIYLASPYNYSPIVHNHPLAEKYDLPKGWDYWQAADTEILRRCDVVYILQLPGWNESRGIKAELELAKTLEIPIGYV